MIEPNYFSDPKAVLAALSLIVAIWAGWNSTRSRRIAMRALELNEQQEHRRHPRLEMHLLDGFRQRVGDDEWFGFHVRVTNHSDTNNAISVAELQITYVIDRDIKAFCRIPQTARPAKLPAGVDANSLLAPVRIDAHQTVQGWLYFMINRSVLNGKTVDTQKLLLLDTNGTWKEVEAIVIRKSE